MDTNMIIQLVSTLGFPIIACGALFWKMNKDDSDHKQEVDKLSDVIANNTIALTKLTDFLTKER